MTTSIDLITPSSPKRSIRNRLRKRRKLKDIKGVYKSTTKFKTIDGDYPIMTNEKILLGTSDMSDMITSQFLEKRINDKLSTIQEKLTVIGNHKLAVKFIRDNFRDALISCPSQGRFIINFGDSLLEVNPYNSTIEFYMHGTFDKIDEFKNIICNTFEEINVYISWIYDKNMNRTTVPIDASRLPTEAMYSFMQHGDTLAEYYESFMASTANILILIGQPGTAKCLDPDEEIEIMVSDEIYEKMR